MRTIAGRRGSRGFTLLEVIIASVILAVIVVLVYALLFASSSEYSNQTLHLKLEERGREIGTELVKEIRMAGGSFTWANPLVSGDPGFSATKTRYTQVTFGIVSGFNMGSKTVTPSLQFGNSAIYRWVADPYDARDGNDNDRDGQVDEGYIEKTTTLVTPTASTKTSKIAENVTYRGLWFEPDNPLDPALIRISLTLQATDNKKKLVTRTVETTATLRN